MWYIRRMTVLALVAYFIGAATYLVVTGQPVDSVPSQELIGTGPGA
jgi:hypothetical protein